MGSATNEDKHCSASAVAVGGIPHGLPPLSPPKNSSSNNNSLTATHHDCDGTSIPCSQDNDTNTPQPTTTTTTTTTKLTMPTSVSTISDVTPPSSDTEYDFDDHHNNGVDDDFDEDTIENQLSSVEAVTGTAEGSATTTSSTTTDTTAITKDSHTDHNIDTANDVDQSKSKVNNGTDDNDEFDKDHDHKDSEDDDDDEEEEEIEIPDEFVCPLTMEIFKDPLMDRRGISFERKAIVEWLNRGNDTCPLTREKLSYSSFIPNANLKLRVERWKDEHGYYHTHPSEQRSSRSRRTRRNSKDSTDNDDDDDDDDCLVGFVGTIDAPPNSMLEMWWSRERGNLLEEYMNSMNNDSLNQDSHHSRGSTGSGGRRRNRRRRRGEGRRTSSNHDNRSRRNNTIDAGGSDHGVSPSGGRGRRAILSGYRSRSTSDRRLNSNSNNSSNNSGQSTPTMSSSTTPTGVSPATQRRRLAGFLGDALNVVRRSGGLAPPLTSQSNH